VPACEHSLGLKSQYTEAVVVVSLRQAEAYVDVRLGNVE